MTATADAIYLPVPSSYPSPFEKFKRERSFEMERQLSGHHRVYRLPRNDQKRWTYAENGYASHQPAIGTIIDILV